MAQGAEEKNKASGQNAPMLPASLPIKDKYDEIFKIEIDCWCYGFIKFPGEITAPLVHRVLKELAGVFRSAIDHNYVFDLHLTTHLIFNSIAKVVTEKELSFAILAQLPAPHELTEDAQFVMAQIVDQAEQRYGGVLERLERRWSSERAKRRAKGVSRSASLQASASKSDSKLDRLAAGGVR